jgi:hypothetical protein
LQTKLSWPIYGTVSALPEEIEKNYHKTSQTSRCYSRDSNQRPMEFKSETYLIKPICFNFQLTRILLKFQIQWLEREREDQRSFPKWSPETDAKKNFKARSLQLIRGVFWLQNILAVNIISQKQEFNVLLFKAAETKYIQIHIYAFTVMKSLSALLKAGYAMKHKPVEQGFCEYMQRWKCIFSYLLNLIGKTNFLVSHVI